MTRDGLSASASSKSSSSIAVALFENTLKLTPSGVTVAPSGALVPGSSFPMYIDGTLSGGNDRPDVPDVAAVLADRAIGREAADARAIKDRHPRPVRLVAIGLAGSLLAVDVGLVVGERQVVVMDQQRLHQRPETLAVAVRERARVNQVDGFVEFRVGL